MQSCPDFAGDTARLAAYSPRMEPKPKRSRVGWIVVAFFVAGVVAFVLVVKWGSIRAWACSLEGRKILPATCDNMHDAERVWR